MTVSVATLGFPRIGKRRELKKALERFWSGASDETDLLKTAAQLRAQAWQEQKERGADILPSNDFSLYDHVLDTSVMVGAVPEIYGPATPSVCLETYFAMARGRNNAPADEMTKWFDTNYHYLVPEFHAGQTFHLAATDILDAYRESRSLGHQTRPVLLGPVSFLLLGKSREDGFHPLTLLENLLPVYEEILAALDREEAEWVQMDEPTLVLDLNSAAQDAFRKAYHRLASAAPALKLMLTPYFGALGENEDLALSLPVHGIHLDLVRAPEQLEPILQKARPDLLLSLGVVDGRNVWRADLDTLLERLEPVARTRDLILAPSCSLMHCPIDLAQETELDPEIRPWLAFALQKIEELSLLAKALKEGRHSVHAALDDAAQALAQRRHSPRIHQPAVQEHTAKMTLDSALTRRSSPFALRQKAQETELALPLFPTTTIGSFPQTSTIRQARARHAKGELSQKDYTAFLQQETANAIAWQEEAGLDVLVHGEFERNDMVQYFGEQLSGFVFTRHAWVQSYGSRYVRPPIIYGDVSRPKPMTLEWWRFAQSCTSRPVKGMLTGPVTILNWSFVRDDQPRSATCQQLALALRDEVCDLEKAGCAIIQIDEAALREGLPLRSRDWPSYLDWAVTCFRITSGGVKDTTQIHTHMCYSEFNDIIEAISAMDADVISIETARSKMELLDAFTHHHYAAGIGPGVYDIHSPRIPSVAEMVELLQAASTSLAPGQLWVNPDCGLKTRHWEEVRPALAHMVQAAREMRRINTALHP